MTKKEPNHIESLVHNLTSFVETRVELAKLQVGEQAAYIISKALIFIALIAILSLFFLFATIALGYFLNALLDSRYLGFVIIAGTYLLFGVILIWKQKAISATLMNYFYKFIETMEDEIDG
ncbi:phage holin family protein [Persicobacter psychrovividus]|uniref:Phage holin family protein n=1 Tax=Persicobacter psychrovividus TaxID=387638 RepID=A0ABM7VHA3_9BACT|nr:hypothetical protein PEPS_26370 [Persicobacter psychrovividus]